MKRLALLLNLMLLVLFAASVSYAGEPKISVEGCWPKYIKRPEMSRMVHHPGPNPAPVPPIWSGAWVVLSQRLGWWR